MLTDNQRRRIRKMNQIYRAVEHRTEWSEAHRDRLVSVLKAAGANVTDWMNEALYYRVNGLRISESGRVIYSSYFNESKRVTEMLNRYGKAIKDNFNYITRG